MARPDHVINIAEKFEAFDQLWSPKVVAAFNGFELKLVRAKGRFVRHSHESTDEVFIVESGQLAIELPDRTVRVGPGEVFVVPKGVEHCPDAGDGCRLMLLEPAGVANTGEVVDATLSNQDEWI